MSTRGTILIVDDTPANLSLLSSMLNEQGYKVRVALNGTLALMTVKATPPDLILLDVNMPGLSGYDVCQQLKESENTRHIPIIFLSALDDTLDKVKAFEVGAVDYITKPFHVEEILARVESQLIVYYQRRELEDLRQKEHQYFDELNSLKEQFVRTVSHDLKVPIGSINGYVDLIEERFGMLDPSLKVFLGRIRQATDQMLDLVKDLLELAKLESGMTLVLEPTPLGQFLQKRQADFELLAQLKQIEISFTLPNPELNLLIDPARMVQVFNNLLSNALKFTPEGGQISVLTIVGDKQVTIEISDTGMGIPADELPRLFDKFYRVRKESNAAVDGTGLGLSIVKGIIDKHKGQVLVRSEVGQGSVFSVILPLQMENGA